MRRHDLLHVDPTAWREMLDHHPGLEDLPLVGDWASQGWPVIVRRRMENEVADGVPAALPLPPCHGKRRVGFSFPSIAGLKPMDPVLLRDAALAAPPAWRPTLSALVRLGESFGVSPRVFGSLLWEHVTKLPYLTQTSDLDLLWSVADSRSAAGLVEGLQRLDANSLFRLDGELELPDGGGVNWRELSQAAGVARDAVLVKTMNGAELRTAAELFDAAACAS